MKQRLIPAFAAFISVAFPNHTRADLLVCSDYNGQILRYDGATGNFLGIFAVVNCTDMMIGPDGNLWVASPDSLSPNATFHIDRLELHTGLPLSSVAIPTQVSFLTTGPDGNVYGTDFFGSRVQKYDGASGSYIGEFVSAGSGGLQQPEGLTFGPDGNLYVSSRNNGEVIRYNGTTGAFMNVFAQTGSQSTSGPQDLEFRSDGYLYLADDLHGVLRFNATTGSFVGTFANSGLSGVSDGMSFTFDDAGVMYVSRQNDDSVERFYSNGAGAGYFVAPQSGGLHYPTALVFNSPVPEPSAAFVLVVGVFAFGFRNNIRFRFVQTT